MPLLKSKFLFLGLLLSFITFTSCTKDEEEETTVPPVKSGSVVTATNTFQSTAFTMGNEQAIEDLFQVPSGSLAVTATVGAGVEFSNYLLNLYDIDIDENSIRFEVVAQSNDPTYKDLFRVLEADTYDRYYLTFDASQNVKTATSSNASVNLRIDSDKILVVEIGEGYDFKPGQSFTISLN